MSFCSANVRYCQTIVLVRKDCTPLINVLDAPWFVGVGSERFVHANRPLCLLIRQMLQMFQLPHSLHGYKKWFDVSLWYCHSPLAKLGRRECQQMGESIVGTSGNRREKCAKALTASGSNWTFLAGS